MANEEIKRTLSIELRLAPSAANARVLDQVSKQVGTALSHASAGPASNLLLGPVAAIQRQLPIITRTNAQIVTIQVRSAAETSRIRLRDEADAARHARAVELVAERSARRLAEIEARANRRTPGQATAPSLGTLAAGALTGNGALAVSAGVAAFAVTAAQSATRLDSLERGLTAIAGSSAKAREQLSQLKEVAKLPGLGFEEAVRGSINLQAAGINARLAERSLAAFGNALATVGKGKAELDGVALALGQIQSKGKVSAEEINQLNERVPQIRKAMIAAFGTAETEILQKQKISAERFITGIVTELEKLPKATGGAQNSFENLSDTANASMAKIGTAVLRIAVPALDRLTPKIEAAGEAFSKLKPETQNAALAIGGFALLAGPVSRGVAGIIDAITKLKGALATLPAYAASAGAAVVAALTLSQTGGDQPTVARARANDEANRLRRQRTLSNGSQPSRASLFNQPGFVRTDDAGQPLPDAQGVLRDKLSSLNAPAIRLPKLTAGGSGGRGGAAQLSEAAQLTKQLADVNRELIVLRNASSREFQLRIQLDAAQETRSQLEDVLKLRRELGRPVAVPIRDAAGELRQLESLREYDKISKETDALELVREANAKRFEAQGEAVSRIVSQIADTTANLTEKTFEQSVATSEAFRAIQKFNPALAEQLRLEAATVDAKRANVDQTRLFTDVQAQLNAQLTNTASLSESQRLSLRLTTGDLSKLTEAQRDNLTVIARQVDARNTEQSALEAARQQYQQFAYALEGVFSDAFQRGPRAFLDSFLNYTKQTLSRVLAQITASGITRILSPQAATATSGRSNGGGFLQSISSVLQPQLAPAGIPFGATTPGFNPNASLPGGLGGGNAGGFQVPGLPRGVNLQQLAGLRNTLSRLPLIGRLFGRAASGVNGAIPLSTINPAQLGGLSANTPLGQAAGVSQASLTGAAAPSALAGLASSGLLAGGGLLGSLAGGGSSTGRLLGGIGGTLGAGFLGALGVFGSGVSAALPALLSNPITAVIAGGLIATALILNLRTKRELGEYKKLIKSEYELDVKDNKILTQIRELGKQSFGKQYKARRLETVRLSEAKSVLLAYADSNGLNYNNKLNPAKLGDP